MKKLFSLLLVLLLICTFALSEALVDGGVAVTDDLIVEYGSPYYSPEEVALYLYAFCELPCNYITKNDARDLGWDSRQGNLWDVAGEGTCIGGDHFGNREGLLPNARGRSWYEADVNYDGSYRGAERLLFSTDGMICYSGDHYSSYTVVYSSWYDPDGHYNGITEVQ